MPGSIRKRIGMYGGFRYLFAKRWGIVVYHTLFSFISTFNRTRIIKPSLFFVF